MGEIYIPWVFCLTLMITLEPMILWWSLLYERKIILRNIPVMEVWMGWAKLLSGKTFQLYGTISSHSVLEFHRPFLPFLSMLIYMYYNRVLPRIKWRPSGWAWFGRSLRPQQSFWLPHQRNRAMEGMGGCYAERTWGEHRCIPVEQ